MVATASCLHHTRIPAGISPGISLALKKFQLSSYKELSVVATAAHLHHTRIPAGISPGSSICLSYRGLSPGQLNWSISRRSPLIDLLTKIYFSKFHVVQPAGLPPGCTTFYSSCCTTRRAPPGLYHILVYVVQPAGLPPGCTTVYSLDLCWATRRAPPGLYHIYSLCCTTFDSLDLCWATRRAPPPG